MANNSGRAPSKKKKKKETNSIENSTIRGVINSKSFRHHGKVKVLLLVLCMEAISVLQMGKNDINRHKTPQSIRDMWMLHNDRKN